MDRRLEGISFVWQAQGQNIDCVSGCPKKRYSTLVFKLRDRFSPKDEEMRSWTRMILTSSIGLVKSTRMLMPCQKVNACSVEENMKDRKSGPGEERKMTKSNW